MAQVLRHLLSLPGPYSAQATVEGITRISQLIKSTSFVVMMVPLLFVLMFWDEVPTEWLLSWWAVLLFVHIGEYLMSRAYDVRLKRVGPPDLAWAIHWARRASILIVFNGLAWGVASMSILVVDSLPHQIMALVITLTFCAVTIFGTSYWPAFQYCSMIPALGLTMLALLLKGDSASQIFAAVVVLYTLILHTMARQAHSSTMSGIQLQFENLDLVKQLHAEKAKAEEANIAKSTFLAAASHDLRQPLHAMTLFADALNGRLQNEDDVLVLGRLQDSLTAMRKLFNALLDISRLDAGIVEPQIKTFQLAPLLERLHVDYAQQSRDKQLEWRCPMTDVVVRSDPVLLENMLRNLVGNAIRYTPQGYVAISCAEVDDWVRIDVEDSGVGIPADKHAEIFREYRQLSNPERDAAKGLGLGLAIVERLAHLLNHRVELRSTPGTGSCFSVILPLGSAADIAPDFDNVAGEETTAESDLVGMLVLVIDDQVAVLEGMQVLLGRWGCQVMLADSEVTAVAVIAKAERKPELIITDYRLRADRTGSQAIDRIRRECGESIPALIITGDTDPERLREAQASGHMLMNKPVPPARLRAFLRTVRRNSI